MCFLRVGEVARGDSGHVGVEARVVFAFVKRHLIIRCRRGAAVGGYKFVVFAEDVGSFEAADVAGYVVEEPG